MFYIIFGAAAGLHAAQVQLLIKNLHLESWYVGKEDVVMVEGLSPLAERLMTTDSREKMRRWRGESEAPGG